MNNITVARTVTSNLEGRLSNFSVDAKITARHLNNASVSSLGGRLVFYTLDQIQDCINLLEGLKDAIEMELRTPEETAQE